MANKNGGNRNEKGQFTAGHSYGRPQGPVNKKTLKTRRLLADSAPALMREAIDQALGGDKPMLKMLVERIAGKGLQVTPSVPAGTNTKKQTQAIMENLQVDGVCGDDVSAHIKIIRSHQTAVELRELKQLVKKAEKKL